MSAFLETWRSHRGHRVRRRLPSYSITTVSWTFRCTKCTRISTCVSNTPGHLSTGQRLRPPFAGNDILYVLGPPSFWGAQRCRRVAAFPCRVISVHGINKDATKITFWNCRNKGRYANDLPDKKTETDTDTDASGQYGSANVTNLIQDATVILQEGVNDGEFYGDDMFSEFYFFNTGHEPMNPEEEHHQIER